MYLRLRESKKDVLTRRFETIRGKLIDRLGELMQAKSKPEQSSDTDGRQQAVGIQIIGVSAQ